LARTPRHIIWLKGWQDHEKREDGAAFAAGLDEPGLDTDPDDLDPVDENELDGDDLFDADDEPELDDELAEPTQPLAAGTAG
jgi:hypothetical protein